MIKYRDWYGWMCSRLNRVEVTPDGQLFVRCLSCGCLSRVSGDGYVLCYGCMRATARAACAIERELGKIDITVFGKIDKIGVRVEVP